MPAPPKSGTSPRHRADVLPVRSDNRSPAESEHGPPWSGAVPAQDTPNRRPPTRMGGRLRGRPYARVGTWLGARLRGRTGCRLSAWLSTRLRARLGGRLLGRFDAWVFGDLDARARELGWRVRRPAPFVRVYRDPRFDRLHGGDRP